MTSSLVAAVLSALLAIQGVKGQTTFSEFDITGVFEGDPFDIEEPLPPPPDGTSVARPTSTKKNNLVRLCGCTDPAEFKIDDIRSISDEWAKDGNRVSSHGFTNLVWAWGQFIDHDVVATVDQDGDDHLFNISLAHNGEMANMMLHRIFVDGPEGECPSPPNVISPTIDAGPVYGDEEEFTQMTIRMPGQCFLRVSEGDMPPVSTVQVKGEYVFVAGDARVDEHSVLTSMHTLWLREHNRLCRVMMTDPRFAGMSADDMFNRARNVVSAKMQQITLREFLPELGITEAAVRAVTPKVDTAEISAEFAMAGYRFGHDLVPMMVGRIDAVSLFNGNKFFGIDQTGKPAADADTKLSSVFRNAAFSLANEIDGRLSDTLRNFLFGTHLEDLFSRNLFRGRDVALSSYADIARCYGQTPLPSVMESTPDAFIGMLRENRTPSSRVFGPTLNALLTEQFHRIFFASDGDFWENRLDTVAGFEEEIPMSTLSRVIRSNVAGTFISANAFNMRERSIDSVTFPNPNLPNPRACDPSVDVSDCESETTVATATDSTVEGDPFADADPFAGLDMGSSRGFTV